MLRKALFIAFLSACSQNQFVMEKSSVRTTQDPDLPPTPITEVRSHICGGGRTLGKHLVIGGNSCAYSETTDQSCDRWGCAIVVNDRGDLHCPEGTQRLVTAGTPEYFVCVRKAEVNIPAPVICGGARGIGKTQLVEQCVDPVTIDQSCNRWGCAVMIDTTLGHSGCPEGKTMVRYSDNLTSFFCLE